MNNLGERLMVALAEQGWLVVIAGADVLVAEPIRGREVILGLEWFLIEDDSELAMTILGLVVVYGLVWPWPPEPEDGWVLGHG
jgi:hypothetical protein